METIKIEITYDNPIRILVPKLIQKKITEYIIKWENKCVPGLIEFLFQNDTLGYAINKAIIKLGSSENFEIDKIYHLIYADDNKLDIILDIYKYDENNLTFITVDHNGLKTITTDTRNITELNETIDWICYQTKKFDEFLNDISALK